MKTCPLCNVKVEEGGAHSCYQGFFTTKKNSKIALRVLQLWEEMQALEKRVEDAEYGIAGMKNTLEEMKCLNTTVSTEETKKPAKDTKQRVEGRKTRKYVKKESKEN